MLLWLVLPLAGKAQDGFYLPHGKSYVEIPFEYSNNFIIVNVMFNGVMPLKFIFDTGAEHTILTKRQISDIFGIRYEREFRVAGSDLKTELIAYLARNVRLDIADKASAPQQDILVLQEDYFRFEEYAGVKVHGILSVNAFSKYIIKINYQRNTITLYDRQAFRLPDDDYQLLPLEITRNKPYLATKLHLRPDSTAPVKLLVDTGAGLPLLLFNDTHPLLHPPANAIPTNIGMGLGGYLQGYTGRIQKLELGTYFQGNIITYFQTLDSTRLREYTSRRNGLIGNALLNRFYVILDYQHARMWLKPNKYYQSEFVYDRSGINLIASGSGLNRFVVQDVLPHSPAADAGLRPGDEIIRVGRTPASFLSLAELQYKFQKKPGKRIRLRIRRGDERLNVEFQLRDLI